MSKTRKERRAEKAKIVKKVEKKALSRKFPFKIGADPEFSMILQNKRVDASNTIRAVLDSKREFIAGNQGYSFKDRGNIGWDGAAQTGEIRPKPADTPEKVIENLGEIFKAFGSYMSIFELSTLSQHASIGGHIHLEMLDDPETGRRMTDQKIRAVHAQVCSFYLPILLSENKANIRLRTKQGYGNLSDFRVEGRGYDSVSNKEIYTYEFRSPSAEWMTTPKIATATLAYLAVIYHEVLKNPKNIKKAKDFLVKNSTQADSLQKLIINDYGILNKTVLKEVAKYIRTFEMYDPYKKEIEFILNPQKVLEEKAKARYDINIGWGISGNNKLTKKKVISDKHFKKEIEKKDADVISRMVQIDYNDDAKVKNFVDALALRVGAFNWKLSKQYYVFGLKRGIKDIIAKNVHGEYLLGTEQIATIGDYIAVNKAFDKMHQKYAGSGKISNLMTIDFQTGQPMSMQESVVFIGLPYDMRMNGKSKNLIDAVWRIESGECVPMHLEEGKLKEEPGEIEKTAKARQELEAAEIPENAIRYDNNAGSRSGSNQQNALAELADELAQEQNYIEAEEEEDDNLDIDEDDELEEEAIFHDAIPESMRQTLQELEEETRTNLTAERATFDQRASTPIQPGQNPGLGAITGNNSF